MTWVFVVAWLLWGWVCLTLGAALYRWALKDAGMTYDDGIEDGARQVTSW